MPTLQELLCGVTLVSVANVAADLETTQAPVLSGLGVVGGTGFEPVTPTMSR